MQPKTRAKWRLLAATLAAMLLALNGCRTTVLYGAHAQTLLEQRVDGYVQLADDDPRYVALERYLAGDPALNRLLLLYEHTTAAFLASGLSSGASGAVANHVVLVLGQQTGLLRNIRVQGLYGDTRVQLALGISVQDPAQLGNVAPALARAVGEALMVLAGQDSPMGPCIALTCDAGAATSSDVLTRGLGAALEAAYVQATAAPDPALPEDASRVAASQRAAWLAANAYRQRFAADGPTGVPLTANEAVACPGVAGALFSRIIAEAETGYPQRYMLWFANYDTADEALAKILLTANRLGSASSVDAFVQAYEATFPRERNLALELEAELQLGAVAP